MNNNFLADIFTNQMVLQRHKDIHFWGKVSPCQTVTVNFNRIKLSAQSTENGDWFICFPPMEAADNLSLTVTCGQLSQILDDIAIGEVWVAGGQSNMEFDLSRCTDWDTIKENPDPGIRFFYTPKLPYESEAYHTAFANAHWEKVSDEGFAQWSAVGYIFAAGLRKKLNVTVGIIGCNWGGTSASCWLGRDLLEKEPSLQIYLDDFEKAMGNTPDDQQKKAYDDYVVFHAAWEKRCTQCYEEKPDVTWEEIEEICGKCQWPGPMNNYNPYRPFGLHELMVLPISKYTVKGVIFYQGESDEHHPDCYYDLFKTMVKQWRQDWNDETLPFVIAEITMHRYETCPDLKNWPVIREAQLKAGNELDNVYTVSIIDCGQFSEIHPVNKGPVGARMANMALCEVYDNIIPYEDAHSPQFDHCEISDNTLEAFIKDSSYGLMISGEPEGFEIAGYDSVYFPADVVVKEHSIVFSSPQVAHPVSARYCWTNYCHPSVFEKNGLPLFPFRTKKEGESSPVNVKTEIRQNMQL